MINCVSQTILFGMQHAQLARMRAQARWLYVNARHLLQLVMVSNLHYVICHGQA